MSETSRFISSRTRTNSITTTSAPVIQPSSIMANSCVNKDDKCNYISQPFYENELKDKNKEKVTNNFESMCGLRDGDIRKCCSLTDPQKMIIRYVKMLKYGFKVQDYMGTQVNEQDCELNKSCVYYACNEADKTVKK